MISPKIRTASPAEEVRDKLMGEVRKLSKMGMMSQEGVVLRNYLDTVLAG